VFDRPTLYLEDLRPARCPVGLVQAGRGRLTEEDLGQMRAGLGDRVAVFVVPEAGHHPMLDRPLDLVEALRTLLAGMLASTAETSTRRDAEPGAR
jgi:pimeloyl-ACP methyl ester carboxylesterase